MKTAVIDVGGGYKAAFAAGVLEHCLRNGIEFDICLGVSVGCSNLTSYIAKQSGRNYRFYAEYSARPEYMSYGNFVRIKSLFDLDYIYGTLINEGGEAELHYSALIGSDKVFKMVATDAQSGAAVYFDKTELVKNDYCIIKAACALPYICSPQTVRGKLYADGTVSDPIPVEKAFELGCDRAVIILSDSPNDMSDEKDVKLSSKIRKSFPAVAATLARRYKAYNASLDLAKCYARQGRALILYPDELYGIDTIVRDGDINKLYESGIAVGKKIDEFLK